MTSFIDKIITSRPVNRTAGVVVGEGYAYTPNKKIQTADQANPILTKPVPLEVRENLTGKRVGRFVVVGYSASDGSKAKWVVRCDCGIYSLRRHKSIKNPSNNQDRCEICRDLMYLKRHDYYRRNGDNCGYSEDD